MNEEEQCAWTACPALQTSIFFPLLASPHTAQRGRRTAARARRRKAQRRSAPLAAMQGRPVALCRPLSLPWWVVAPGLFSAAGLARVGGRGGAGTCRARTSDVESSRVIADADDVRLEEHGMVIVDLQGFDSQID